MLASKHSKLSPDARTRTKEAHSVNVTPSSRLHTKTIDMPGGQKRGRLVGARAAAGKSCLLRYTIRWQEIAMLHRVLEAGSNRRPAGETLDRVGRAVKGEQRHPFFVFCTRLIMFATVEGTGNVARGSSRRLIARLGASSPKIHLEYLIVTEVAQQLVHCNEQTNLGSTMVWMHQTILANSSAIGLSCNQS